MGKSGKKKPDKPSAKKANQARKAAQKQKGPPNYTNDEMLTIGQLALQYLP